MNANSENVALLMRIAGFAALWALLTGGSAGSWTIGAPTACLAAWARGRLKPEPRKRLRPVAAARFAGFFVREGLRGGIDIARRALDPALPISPITLHYPLQLADAAARVFFTNTVSLLPGTLVIELGARSVTVHVLAATPGVTEELRALETRVAALFGCELRAAEEGAG